MHIVFLTHYFPPEVNAPASRTFENATRWVKNGHRVTVITCAPNHPKGVLYPGYKHKWFQFEIIDGIQVFRVKTYLSANKRIIKRTLNYFSYMVSSVIFSPKIRNVDIVISTSPQFFCGAAGFLVSRIKKKPWILEIRDLWPESIIAVGALNSRLLINLLESLETFLYRRADHVVAVTHAFKRHIATRRVSKKDITVITNGADLTRFNPQNANNQFRERYKLHGKCVLSYVGTHGMAHSLETVLKTAKQLKNNSKIKFVLVGDGAEREHLLRLKDSLGLNNVLMLPQQPKEKIPEIISASDGCMVLLKDTPLFRTVIPSKIFEAMAMQRPIVLGVKGESRSIVERAECGICIEPESDTQLAEAAIKLLDDNKFAHELGKNGRQYVENFYNRDILANQFLDIMMDTK